MPPAADTNAITRRLDLVRERYRTLPPDATGLCLWEVVPGEVRMLESFVLLEASPHSVFPDFFITLTGGAAGATNYPRQLVADLQSQLRADADALLEAGVDAVVWEQVVGFPSSAASF